MNLDKKDVKVDRFRATGNGGQNVNTRETAIRLTHLPTGIVATSQDQRTQAQNHNLAWKVLTERVQRHYAGLRKEERDELRNELFSGRVRTYNFKTNTVKDHRTGKMYRLADILDGNLPFPEVGK